MRPLPTSATGSTAAATFSAADAFNPVAGNDLLAALSAQQRAQWLPALELVNLERGDVLCEAGRVPSHLVFPTSAIVSLMLGTQDGASSEIAVVGCDGVVGVSLFMGGGVSPCEAVVQSRGQAYRLRSQLLMNGLAGPTLHTLLRYAQSLMAQIAQTAACNRFHAIDQRLCRRLLMGLDRSATAELAMTQEQAAELLGVRREGITLAARKLQQAGVIHYHRGHIVVNDRQRLQQRSCECYAASQRDNDRLLPLPMAA